MKSKEIIEPLDIITVEELINLIKEYGRYIRFLRATNSDTTEGKCPLFVRDEPDSVLRPIGTIGLDLYNKCCEDMRFSVTKKGDTDSDYQPGAIYYLS